MAQLPALEVIVVYAIAAFAGGAFGAALGALPAFIFTGFLVIAGEAANLASKAVAEAGAVDPASLGTVGITASLGFGPVFGPHVSFAGGAAAAAYAAKRGYMDTDFDYHEAKNILFAHGTKPDVLAVGGAFGVLGYVSVLGMSTVGLPWDPIAATVVLSAVVHRVAFGYPLVGDAPRGLLNMRPFVDEEPRFTGDEVVENRRVADGAGETRLLVEPWLPHQYEWSGVTMLGLVVGILGGFIALVTGSAFLGFGISAASLVFLNCGVEKIPVTHHITLPASTAALAVVGGSAPESLGLSAVVAVLVAAGFGIAGALSGEVVQRIFYAHSDTHLDPPAFAIALTTLLIAVLTVVGVFETSVWVPTLGLAG